MGARLNRLNGMQCASMHGSSTDTWQNTLCFGWGCYDPILASVSWQQQQIPLALNAPRQASVVGGVPLGVVAALHNTRITLNAPASMSALTSTFPMLFQR
jgi:hypothetical protein